MNILAGASLLRMLGARATPGVAPGPAAPPAPGLDFATLLGKARAGELSSGREVTIARTAGVQLSPEQVRRLSAAADVAESQGATRALVIMDGMTLRLDVAMREVTGVVDLKKDGVLTGIDSVIEVPPECGHGAAPGAPPGLTRALNNPSILNMLAKRDGPKAA